MFVYVNSSNVVKFVCHEAGCKCVPIASKSLPTAIKIAVEKDMRAGDGTSFAVLPVFEIDGLKVRCTFFVNENGMSLSIRTKKMMMYVKTQEERVWLIHQLLFRKTYIKKLTKYTLKDYECVLKHIHKDIKVMKFDKLNGVFVTPQIIHPREVPHVYTNTEMLNSVPCDEEHPEECSVCLDTTKTTTPCGHKLCLSCWSQIKLKGRELPCPICRADLFQSKKIDVKDDHVDYDIADAEGAYDDTDDDSDDDSDDDDDLPDLVDNFEEDYDEFPSVRQNTIVDLT